MRNSVCAFALMVSGFACQASADSPPPPQQKPPLTAPVSIDKPAEKPVIQSQSADLELRGASMMAVQEVAVQEVAVQEVAVQEVCSDFIGYGGWDLVDRLAASDPECVDDLYQLQGPNATSLFSENNMRHALAGIRDRALVYTGVDTDGIQSLIYYVRAAYYVQYYTDDIPEYSIGVISDVKTALTNLFENSAVWTPSRENGPVLQEALILIDSATLGHYFHWVTLKVLRDFDSDWGSVWEMNSAANSIFTTLFRAQWSEEMQALFVSDPSILDDLYNFQEKHRYLLGTDGEYVLVNAAREMARFYYIDAFWDKTKSYALQVLNSTSKEGDTKALWVAVGEMADYYDRANCNEYDICGFKYNLEQETLGFNYECSDTLKMRAQDMFNDQAAWACGVLGGQEEYFHSKLGTDYRPVSNDNNDDLELVVFNSSSDYSAFAGTLFSIPTNNGGMYLEGSPGSEKNQARFIAYEAEWDRPDFHVWNLQHEYVHYLDGRFNLYGDFGRSISADTIWWIEGLAEYISYQDAFVDAVELGQSREYALSTVFDNNYSSGQDRIYDWGYLAVRFMFEKHPEDVGQILSFTRNDQYEDYQNLIDNIGTRYDSEWFSWLTSGLSVKTNGIVNIGPNDTDSQASGNEGNWEGEPGNVSLDFSQCQPDSESNRHDPDENRVETDQLVECIDSLGGSAGFVFLNESRSDQSLWIKIGGGWGDADIYYSSDTWATGELNEAFSIADGNYEVLEVQLNPNEAWHYITLSGEFGGVDMVISSTAVTAEIDPDLGDTTPTNPPTNPPTPPTNPPTNPPSSHCGNTTISNGQLTFGSTECLSGGSNHFYIWVEDDNTAFTVTLSGGDGNADIYYSATSWAGQGNADLVSASADNEELISGVANSGWRYITVDSASEFSGASLTVSLGEAGEVTPTPTPTPTPIPPPVSDGDVPDACLSSDPTSYTELSADEVVCASSDRNDYYVYVNSGTSSLTLDTDHGTGDIAVYGKSGNWPYDSEYDVVSDNAGTVQSLSIANPPAGWYYFVIESASGTSGVSALLGMQ